VHHSETLLEEEGATTTSCNAEVIPNPMTDMVMDAYAPMASMLLQKLPHHMKHEPNLDAKRFLELVKAAGRPSHEGCEMSLLKVVAWLTNLKCEYNLPSI